MKPQNREAPRIHPQSFVALTKAERKELLSSAYHIVKAGLNLKPKLANSWATITEGKIRDQAQRPDTDLVTAIKNQWTARPKARMLLWHTLSKRRLTSRRIMKAIAAAAIAEAVEVPRIPAQYKNQKVFQYVGVSFLGKTRLLGSTGPTGEKRWYRRQDAEVRSAGRLVWLAIEPIWLGSRETEAWRTVVDRVWQAYVEILQAREKTTSGSAESGQ